MQTRRCQPYRTGRLSNEAIQENSCPGSTKEPTARGLCPAWFRLLASPLPSSPPATPVGSSRLSSRTRSSRKPGEPLPALARLRPTAPSVQRCVSKSRLLLPPGTAGRGLSPARTHASLLCWIEKRVPAWTPAVAMRSDPQRRRPVCRSPVRCTELLSSHRMAPRA